MHTVARHPAHFFTLGEFTIAAETIQRAWRSTPTFTTQLRSEARGNASQLGYQPFGRDSLGGNIDFLNHDHIVWQCTDAEDKPVKQKISFADECSVRSDVDGTSPTDFHDPPDKSSRLFANTIVSLFGGETPLYKLFSHRNAPAMEAHFKDAICKLEAGQKVSIWDGQSTKLQATDKSLAKVKECFVKYNYFMKSFGQSVHKVTLPSCQPPLHPSKPEKSFVCTMKPLKNKVPVKPMGLVRLAPRKVAGVKMIDQGPSVYQRPSVFVQQRRCDEAKKRLDALEERLQKMMNLPYSK